METAFESMEVMKAMAEEGLQNSLSDAGVGMLCARAAVFGAYFNVLINAKELKDRQMADQLLNKARNILNSANSKEQELTSSIEEKL